MFGLTLVFMVLGITAMAYNLVTIAVLFFSISFFISMAIWAENTFGRNR